MKHYSPTGRRNHGRPLKKLLDTWDRNWSTSDPTPWQIYDDDDDDIEIITNRCILNSCVICQGIDYKLPEDDTIVSKHVGT
jgi:hypothetical protein